MDSADKKAFLDKCIAEEKKYTFPEFARNDAWELGHDLVESTKDFLDDGPLAVSIFLNGTEVFRWFPEGTGLFHEQWLRRKYNTVTTLDRASMTWKAKLACDGSSLEAECLNPMDYADCGGGFPIRIKGGAVIGFIGVSGLSDDKDQAALIAGLDKFFKRHNWA